MIPEAWTCPTCGGSERNARKRCRACERAYQRAWRKANPEKERAANRRKLYGVTDAEVERLLSEQAGRCRICQVSEADSVDHCHATGRIRAMLCRACNAGLGLFRDDPGLLRAASAYLKL